VTPSSAITGEVGVGVIGLGFIGRIHLAAYQAARRDGYPCRVVAVCDHRPEQLRADPETARAAGFSPRGAAIPEVGNLPVAGATEALDAFSASEVRTYTDPRALLADDRVQLVSICTYTDTHADLAIAALEAGKHVLVEKPVALTSAEVERVAAVARRSGRVCMPAMCMRFWPGWSWLKEQIEPRTFGPVHSATFQRLGSRPGWGTQFYADAPRSGAALFDLHIHDADFIRWCFGPPAAVVSTGDLYHVTTAYRYDSGPPHVTAEAGWDHAPGFAFRMRYVVNFAEATADFDLLRDPPLLLTRGGRSEPVPLPPLTGYDNEVRHLLEVLTGRRPDLIARMQEAVAVARLLDAERRSLETDQIVRLAPLRRFGGV